VKIREAFLANKHLSEPDEILEQVKVAEETDVFLKQAVIQARFSTEKNAYEMKITEDTYLHDNVPLKEAHVVDLNDYKVPEKYRQK